MISRMLADLATKPGLAPVFDTPSNYGLAYEDVVFKTEDGVTLSGWLVNPGQDHVIVQTHFGIQCSRSGYTIEGKGMMKGWDTDLPFLPHIKHLADAGYTVLAYDLRNHGRSGRGTTPWVCDGQEEYQDVLAAVRFMTTHPDYQNTSVGLLSFCMGSSSTFLAYGIDGGLQDVPHIKALVVVQPLYSGAWLRQMGFPRFMVNGAIRTSVHRGGPDFGKSPIDRVKHITVPTLVLQNAKDPWADTDYVRAVYENLRPEKEMVWVDLAPKRLAAYGYFRDHPEKMLEWFGRFVRTESRRTPPRASKATPAP